MPFHMKVAYAFHKFQASWDIQVRRGLNATKEILSPSAHDVINEQYSSNHIHICEIQSLTDRVVHVLLSVRIVRAFASDINALPGNIIISGMVVIAIFIVGLGIDNIKTVAIKEICLTSIQSHSALRCFE